MSLTSEPTAQRAIAGIACIGARTWVILVTLGAGECRVGTASATISREKGIGRGVPRAAEVAERVGHRGGRRRVLVAKRRSLRAIAKAGEAVHGEPPPAATRAAQHEHHRTRGIYKGCTYEALVTQLPLRVEARVRGERATDSRECHETGGEGNVIEGHKRLVEGLRDAGGEDRSIVRVGRVERAIKARVCPAEGTRAAEAVRAVGSAGKEMLREGEPALIVHGMWAQRATVESEHDPTRPITVLRKTMAHAAVAHQAYSRRGRRGVSGGERAIRRGGGAGREER